MHNSVLAICMLILSVDDVFSDGNSAQATDTNEETKPGEQADDVYIGCFAQGCLHLDYVVDLGNLTTPDSCTAACNESGFPLAGVFNRSKCSCSCFHTCFKPVEDDKCGVPCRGDPVKLCGGYTAASVYTVSTNSSNNTICYLGDDEENGQDATLDDNGTKRELIYISVITVTPIGVLIFVIIRTGRKGIHCYVITPRSVLNTPSELASNHGGQDTLPSRSHHHDQPLLQQPFSLERRSDPTPQDYDQGFATMSGSNVYFTLEAEETNDEVREGNHDDNEAHVEGTAEYAYADFSESTTRFCRERDQEGNDVEMVENALYAMPQKKGRSVRK